MSVICFDDQYLKDIGKSILKSEAGRWAITYSDVFAAENRSPYGFGRGLSEEPIPEEKKESYIATQLLYLMGIANKVAFSVTYGERLELNTLTSLDRGRFLPAVRPHRGGVQLGETALSKVAGQQPLRSGPGRKEANRGSGAAS